MKHLFMMFLLVGVLATSVTVSPSHVRTYVGFNESFEIQMVGEGKLYELKIYGAYLSWQTQKIWVGPTGRSTRVTFSPIEEGEYTVTADLEGVQGEATVTVHALTESDLQDRIMALRSRQLDSAALAILNEAERLYNESRFQLAEMKLDELDGRSIQEPPPISDFPKIFLVALIAIAALVAAKLLLG